MNSSYLPSVLIVILLLIGGCAQASPSEKSDISMYLKEAKECYVDGVRISDNVTLTDELQKKLEGIGIEDYIDERHLKSGELLIHFRKSNGETYSIELEVDLNKANSCSRISVYEILG